MYDAITRDLSVCKLHYDLITLINTNRFRQFCDQIYNYSLRKLKQAPLNKKPGCTPLNNTKHHDKLCWVFGSVRFSMKICLTKCSNINIVELHI